MTASLPQHLTDAIQSVVSADNLTVAQDDIRAQPKARSVEVVIKAGKSMEADKARNLLSSTLADADATSVVKEKSRRPLDGPEGGEEVVLEVFVGADMDA